MHVLGDDKKLVGKLCQILRDGDLSFGVELSEHDQDAWIKKVTDSLATLIIVSGGQETSESICRFMSQETFLKRLYEITAEEMQNDENPGS